MPFILKKYPAIIDEKIQIYLLKSLKLGPSFSQKSLSRGRVFDENMKPFKNSDVIKTNYIFIAQFKGETQGLKPLFQTKDLAVFDKPTNLMVHPVGKYTKYCLLDEVRYHFGEKANLVHRIDAETSGLIMCSTNKKSERILKKKFEEKEYKKSYLAIVEGEIKQSLSIETLLTRENKMIGVRMMVSKTEGKASKTIIKPIQYNANKHQTIVEAIPITGRQHQIRVHLYSIGHRIVGDPIYGVKDEIADDYLNKKLPLEERIKATGAKRLWLHANYLEFNYQGLVYKLFSQNKDLYDTFNSSLS